tara:strand:- start:2982 stop:3155 length:174 start_codon:yes stop_codon:yes gene_type:complete
MGYYCGGAQHQEMLSIHTETKGIEHNPPKAMSAMILSNNIMNPSNLRLSKYRVTRTT